MGTIASFNGLGTPPALFSKGAIMATCPKCGTGLETVHAAPEDMTGQASAMPSGGGPFRRMIAAKRQELIDGMVAKGVPHETAAEAIGSLGDGKILALLIQYGPQIIAIIMKLFGL